MAALIAALFTAAEVGILIDYFDDGQPEKKSLMLVLGFSAAAILLIGWTIKSLLRWILTGQTLVDVSAPVAVAGEPLEVIVHQPGKFQISKCLVALVCEERATYTHGSDTTTQTEIVETIPVCELENVDSRQGQMLTRQTTVVPPNLMPTFEAKNNSIIWMIRVTMEIPRRPDSTQDFPIKVLPPQISSPEVQR